jgi:hypothetical protein
MALLGIILTVTGVLALVITRVRGPNLGLSRRTGYVAGVVLFVLGVLLLGVALALSASRPVAAPDLLFGHGPPTGSREAPPGSSRRPALPARGASQDEPGEG